MPTYEFRCANGHEFEQFHRRISDAPSTAECPVCGAPAERRISGGAGLLFKGSGFYLTDYGKNAHRSDSAPKADAAKSDSGGGGGSKSDGGSSGGSSGSSSASGGSSGSSGSGGSSGSSGGSGGSTGKSE